MKRSLAVLTVSAALVLSACGGGSDTPALSAAKIEKALLSAGDLPGGLSKEANDPSGSVEFTKGDRGCKALIDNTSEEADDVTASAKVTFAKSQMPPFVEETIAARKAGSMAEAFDAAKEGLDSCKKFTSGRGDDALPFTVEKTSAADVGDDVIAFRLSFTAGDFTLVLNATAIRVGENAIYLSSAGDKETLLSAAQNQKIAEKAVEKVEAAA